MAIIFSQVTSVLTPVMACFSSISPMEIILTTRASTVFNNVIKGIIVHCILWRMTPLSVWNVPKSVQLAKVRRNVCLAMLLFCCIRRISRAWHHVRRPIMLLCQVQSACPATLLVGRVSIRLNAWAARSVTLTAKTVSEHVPKAHTAQTRQNHALTATLNAQHAKILQLCASPAKHPTNFWAQHVYNLAPQTLTTLTTISVYHASPPVLYAHPKTSV